VARDVIGRVSVEGRSNAAVVALSGDLGAGKTTLVKTLAEALGLQESITSPTFVIEQIYDLPRDAMFARLVHMDAYRLASASELTALGWQELVADPQNLIVVEWPEHVRERIPKDAVWVTMAVAGEEEREIEIVERRT